MPCIEAEMYLTKPYPMFSRSAIGLWYVFFIYVDRNFKQTVYLFIKRAILSGLQEGFCLGGCENRKHERLGWIRGYIFPEILKRQVVEVHFFCILRFILTLPLRLSGPLRHVRGADAPISPLCLRPCLLSFNWSKLFNRTISNSATCICRVQFCSKSQPIDLFAFTAAVLDFFNHLI